MPISRPQPSAADSLASALAPVVACGQAPMGGGLLTSGVAPIIRVHMYADGILPFVPVTCPLFVPLPPYIPLDPFRPALTPDRLGETSPMGTTALSIPTARRHFMPKAICLFLHN